MEWNVERVDAETLSAVIARGAFSRLAIAPGIAEAGQMTKPSVDPPRPAGPAARLTHLGLGDRGYAREALG